jgi:hypothetical protein
MVHINATPRVVNVAYVSIRAGADCGAGFGDVLGSSFRDGTTDRRMAGRCALRRASTGYAVPGCSTCSRVSGSGCSAGGCVTSSRSSRSVSCGRRCSMPRCRRCRVAGSGCGGVPGGRRRMRRTSGRTSSRMRRGCGRCMRRRGWRFSGRGRLRRGDAGQTAPPKNQGNGRNCQSPSAS